MRPNEAAEARMLFPVLEVSAFVDPFTAVLTGHRTDSIKPGEELYVIGVGNTIVPNTNVRLVSPKSRLNVTVAAGAYVLAKAPYITSTQPSPLSPSFEHLLKPRQVKKRPAIVGGDTQFLGNPGKDPVRLGDIVIRIDDLADYVKATAIDKTNG